MPPISMRSIILPISLLACIMLTMVFSLDAASNSSKWVESICPFGRMFTRLSLALYFLAKWLTVCKVAWCSIGELIICLHSKFSMAACKTVLLLSVPPLVKKISAGRAPKILATCFLACSMAILVSRP